MLIYTYISLLCVPKIATDTENATYGCDGKTDGRTERRIKVEIESQNLGFRRNNTVLMSYFKWKPREKLLFASRNLNVEGGGGIFPSYKF